jgi:hypothetical protein
MQILNMTRPYQSHTSTLVRITKGGTSCMQKRASDRKEVSGSDEEIVRINPYRRLRLLMQHLARVVWSSTASISQRSQKEVHHLCCYQKGRNKRKRKKRRHSDLLALVVVYRSKVGLLPSSTGTGWASPGRWPRTPATAA